MIPLPFHVLRQRNAAIAVGVPTVTITTTFNGLFHTVWRGTNGAGLSIDWGDGSATSDITLLGSGTDVDGDHTYSTGAEKTIQVTGNLTDVLRFTNNSALVSAVDFRLLSSITYISLGGNSTLSDLSSFANLTGLTHLYLNGMGITDVSFSTGLSNLVVLWVLSNPITYTTQTWFTATSGIFYFYSCVTTAGEVDQWLIDLAAANWSNCTIRLDGTNPARTSASDAAVSVLNGNGVTLYVN